jgi:RimJ/RimL family protein N-acetyltransferase
MGSPVHLLPLLLDERTKEPYLRLPPPHSNIILTPPRLSDSEAIVQILNDRRVFQWLESTPYPYHTDHAKQWLEATLQEAEMLLRQLEETAGGFVGGCPVRILREVKENGDQVFLGDCGIGKWGFDDVQDPVEREKLWKENDQRLPGDLGTVWGFGGAAW